MQFSGMLLSKCADEAKAFIRLAYGVQEQVEITHRGGHICIASDVIGPRQLLLELCRASIVGSRLAVKKIGLIH
jgi:hypothetical protein